jgi:phosphoribosylglycinamide formyltransferase-1
MNVAVLASGSGTNLELGPARLAAVGVNVPDCRAFARAQAAGIATFVVDHRQYAVRDEFDRALVAAMEPHEIDLVVLAGFMRLLGPSFLGRYGGRVINIHPALLPAFPGVHAQRQAAAYGVKLSGCTVHFVEAGVDSGPVIAQAAVPVRDDDDEASLAARILVEEHRLLPSVVRALAEGRVTADGRRVRVIESWPSGESLRTM